MKTRHAPWQRSLLVSSLAAVAALIVSSAGLRAANATWNGAGDSVWSNEANWSTVPVPGSGDVATFNGAGNGNIGIDLGSGVTVQSIVFDTASAAAYAIGLSPAGSQFLTFNGGGGITRNSTVTAGQTFNAGLLLGESDGDQAFTFTNSSTSNSLTFAGGLSSAFAGLKALTVSSAGTTVISGAISDGAGVLALNKTGAGALTLSGANSYSGGTTITGLVNANHSSAFGTGGITVNNASGDRILLGNGVNVGNAITLNGGGAVGIGILHVAAGNHATYSGTINITAASTAGSHLATDNSTATLTIAGDNTVTSSVPVSVRNGTVIFTGAQNFTGGVQTLTDNSRSRIHFAKTASMPDTGTVSITLGNSLGVNVGGTGEFAASGSGAGTISGILAGIGGQDAPVTFVTGASLAIDTSNAPDKVTFSNGFNSVNNVGLLKLGSGTLELTASGTYNGAGAGAFPMVVRQGELLLNGGTHTVGGELVVGGTYGTAAGAAGHNATLRVDQGALSVGSWLSIGRGNGVGGVSSDLVINNNATVTALNFSAGFNGGSASNLPKGTITLNQTAALNVNGATSAFILGESPGSNMTLNINDSASVTHAGSTMYIGHVSGHGTLNMAGGSLTAVDVRVGGSPTNGTTVNGTGTVNMTGGTMNLGSLVIARGNNNQNTVSGNATIGAGTVNITNDLVLGFAGNGNLGKMTISGGVVNVGMTAAKWVQVGVWDTSRGQLDITAGQLNLLNGTQIKMNSQGTVGANVINQSGGSVTFYSDAGLTVGGGGHLDMQRAGAAASSNTYNLDGGTLVVPQVLSTATTGTRTFNFNGGTLRATGDNAAFFNLGTGSARANVRNGGAIIDTNGFNVTIAQALLHSNLVGDAAIDGGLTKLGVGTLTLTGVNTYTGNTSVSGGALALASTGSLFFKIGNAGIGTQILGSGVLDLNGTFNLDLSGAAHQPGNVWTLVGSSLVATYGSSFVVRNFTTSANFVQAGNVWTSADNQWQFSATTGQLSAIPEPSTYAFIAGLAGLALAVARRRRRS
jgi:MYXO-CTERM domain-containing protein